MRQVFRAGDSPAEVIGRIRAAGGVRWEELEPGDRSIGIGRLRLGGVYDDRQDGYFMLRTRIPGGRLTAAQAETIAGIVDEFAVRPDPGEAPDPLGGPAVPDRFVEITTRQDLQVHWVRFEALPEIWRRYEAVGLTSAGACGDTLRNVTSCPVDGLDPAAALEAEPVVRSLGALVAREPGLTATLPRKFKVAVTGCRSDCVLARIQDLAFTPARREGQIGFNVHAGGGLSDSPRLASPLDLFVPPGRVVDVVRAALRLYAEQGDPLHKAVNRFRVLVHELGPEAVRADIARRMPALPAPAGEPLSTWTAEDHLGIHPDRHGLHWVGLCVPLGRLVPDDLGEIARLARVHGDGEIRLTQRQNLILTGVREVDRLLTEPLLRRLRPFPDPFERGVVACTSAPFCKFAILDVKRYGAELIGHLRRAVPGDGWEALQGVRVHLSGCKASCAQIQTADIGLRATMARAEDGYRDAFDLAIDGDVGAGRLARWTALEVPADAAFERVAASLAKMAAERAFRAEQSRHQIEEQIEETRP